MELEGIFDHILIKFTILGIRVAIQLSMKVFHHWVVVLNLTLLKQIIQMIVSYISLLLIKIYVLFPIPH